MSDLLKKQTVVPFLEPKSSTFKQLLNTCIKARIADLVIQEGNGISIITPTKETKSFDEANKNISNKQEFILECLEDIILDSEKLNIFLSSDDVSEVSIGINYRFFDDPDDEKAVGRIVRLRCTCIKELRGFQINIRIGNPTVADYGDLGISEKFRELFNYKEGLILVAGPTGSGKTTTINSLLKDVLKTEHKHLLTLEDPVEYVYDDKEIVGLVTYREQGTNFKNYFEGIKNSLRLSPNIIMIGEIRDAETANAVLEAVLGGHLVISTLHTSSVVGTIQKFVKWAQMTQNEENINVFGELMRGIMIQKLIKVDGPNGKKTTLPIREILYNEKRITNAIKRKDSGEGVDYNAIKNKMNEVGPELLSSVSMNKYLIGLYEKGILNSPERIFENSNDIDGLINMIKEDKIKFSKMFENKTELFENLMKKYGDN